MKDQDTWKKDEEIELHNCKWGETILNPPQIVLKPLVKEPALSEELPVEEPDEEYEVETPEPEASKLPKAIDKKIVIIYCLPTVVKIIKDELYGDERETTNYGNKFTFEGIIVSRTDLTLQFWTTIQLTKGSVVFPSKYKTGIKFGGYRWWSVTNTEAKTGGFITHCVPSNVQPDFGEITA